MYKTLRFTTANFRLLMSNEKTYNFDGEMKVRYVKNILMIT